MSITKIIDWQESKTKSDLIGKIASPFYQLYDDQQGFTWACDVDIGDPEVLRNVPVATNNKDILYADVGKPVALKRIGKNKYQIVGLAKTAVDTTHIIFVKFEGDYGDPIPGEISGEEWQGFTLRRLTYGELAMYGGYGTVPYGAYARFKADGTLDRLIY